MNKAYLGDAVYVEVDRLGDLILTTENGIRATNRIVLEPAVLAALEQYLEAVRAKPTDGEG
jgi:hypothetical protein